MNSEVKKARRKILKNLRDYGVGWDYKKQRIKPLDDEGLREMQLKLSQTTNLSGLKFKSKAEPYFAKSEELDILKVEPYLVPVQDDYTSKVWSYALTNWSVPVSAGYGRRMRFLVFDKQNEKLIGVFGLCDPLIGSVIRDKFIGWNREQKIERLYNCLTAYILGAVPPYNRILGSKLVALTTMFPKVRELFREKYKNNQTVISDKHKLPELAFIDTYGAFQKSAIYTRLLNWKFVDYTKGQSHIHLTANGSWETITKFVPEDRFDTYGYGQGSNWKLRTLRIGLENLGFDEHLLSIGWKRAYYVCPLATNWKEFLTMKHKKPKFLKHTEKDLINEWRNRWVIPRLEKLQDKLNEAL
jgi:hypothetical protein